MGPCSRRVAMFVPGFSVSSLPPFMPSANILPPMTSKSARAIVGFIVFLQQRAARRRAFHGRLFRIARKRIARAGYGAGKNVISSPAMQITKVTAAMIRAQTNAMVKPYFAMRRRRNLTYRFITLKSLRRAAPAMSF